MIETECSICFQTFSEGDVISYSHNSNCRHHFHKDCIVDWLARDGRCPTCRRFYLEKIKHGEEGGEEDGGIVNNDFDDDEGFIRNIDDNEEISDEENQTIVQEQLHTNNYDECDDLEEPTAMHENEGSTERSSQNLNSFVNDCHINFPVSIPTT